MSVFGPWLPMPEQQQLPPGSPAGRGAGSHGSRGQSGDGERDRQDRAREAREREDDTHLAESIDPMVPDVRPQPMVPDKRPEPIVPDEKPKSAFVDKMKAFTKDVMKDMFDVDLDDELIDDKQVEKTVSGILGIGPLSQLVEIANRHITSDWTPEDWERNREVWGRIAKSNDEREGGAPPSAAEPPGPAAAEPDPEDVLPEGLDPDDELGELETLTDPFEGDAMRWAQSVREDIKRAGARLAQV